MKGVVGKLTQGAADAGFVYVTDVEATNGKLRAIELPKRLRPSVAYGVAVVEGSEGARGRAGRSSTACSRARAARRCARPASSRRRDEGCARSRRAAGGLARRGARLPDAPAGGDLRGRRARASCSAASTTRASLDALVAEPSGHGDRPGADRGAGHARGVAAGHAARFRGRALAITLVELPLVVPPAVAGIGLLAALGPEGLLGGTLADAGVELVFQTAGVVVALAFVASPFYIRQALAAFAALDPDAGGGLAHARAPARGARSRGSRCRTRCPASWRAPRWRGAARWASSAPRWSSPAASAASPRPRRWRSTSASATTSPRALALSAVLVAVSAAILLGVKLRPAARALGDARA